MKTKKLPLFFFIGLEVDPCPTSPTKPDSDPRFFKFRIWIRPIYPDLQPNLETYSQTRQTTRKDHKLPSSTYVKEIIILIDTS